MTTWQEHPLDEQPAEFFHLGQLHELAEEREQAAITTTGFTVHPNGAVEYECAHCGDWCIRNIEEACVHYGECLPCYIDGADAAVLLAETSDPDGNHIALRQDRNEYCATLQFRPDPDTL